MHFIVYYARYAFDFYYPFEIRAGFHQKIKPFIAYMYEDILPFALNLFYDLVICWFYDNSFIKIIPNGIGSIPERSFCQGFFQDFISKICFSAEFEIWYSFVSTTYSN